MRASEARDITKEKAITIEKVLDHIKSQANHGQSFQRYFDVTIDLYIISDLIELGYKIEQSKGLMGEKVITISWD